MEHSTRLAHISEDGTRTQTVYDHLVGTARLAGSFAAPFGAQSEAEFAAWLHDVGEVQRRLPAAAQRRPQGGPLHRRGAGAWVRHHLHAAFAVAGHHSGLPDGGSPPMTRATPPCWPEPEADSPYDGWQEVTLPPRRRPRGLRRPAEPRVLYPDALLLPRGRRLHRHRDLHGRQGRTPGQRHGHRRAAGHRLDTGAALSQGRVALARQRPAQHRPPRLSRERRSRPAGALHPNPYPPAAARPSPPSPLRWSTPPPRR